MIGYGCSCLEETVREEKIKIVPQVIEAQIPAKSFEGYVEALKIDLKLNNNDTIRDTLISVKYYPKDSLMDVKVKPPELEIKDIDTLFVEKDPVIIKPSIWEKLGYGFAGFLVTVIVVIIFKRFS